MSEVNKAHDELTKKLKDTENMHRIVSNGLNWLLDVSIEVKYLTPVSEFVGFLEGFKKGLLEEKAKIEAQLPKPEPTEPAKV